MPDKPPEIIAWALAVFHRATGSGNQVGVVITHEFDPQAKGATGRRGDRKITLWEDEYEALGPEHMHYSIGTPDGPDGLYVFECIGAYHDPGEAWASDPSTEIEGSWRPLHACEWRQIADDSNLEAFCAMTKDGQRIEWPSPEMIDEEG